MSLSLDKLLQAMRSVIKDSQAPVQLHEPFFKGNEWTYVKDCIDTGWVSTVGKYVGDFERKIAEVSGTKYAIATMNGTSALHIALKVSGVKEGDEVLIPSLTFIATANAVSYCGATPHFIDSTLLTFGVDSSKLESYLETILDDKGRNKVTGRRVAALVPVHVFGHPVDMDLVNNVAEKFGITVVEDAAESIGSTYKGKRTGSLGNISALSFNGNKIITTGGGGAIVTNDEDLAQRARHLSTTARVGSNWGFYHDEIGYNYRMPSINAALGLAQLENLEEFVRRKRNLAEKYSESFSSLEGLSLFKEAEWAKSNYWLNAIILDQVDMDLRNDVINFLNGSGYGCRPVWTLMHKLPMYKNCPRMDLSCAEDLEKRIINIPSGPQLGDINAC